MNLDEKRNGIINITYFLLCAFVAFLIYRIISEYLLPFSIGIIVAYCVQKPAGFLAKKSKFKKESLASVLAVVLFVVLIGLILLLGWLICLKFVDFFEFLTVSPEKTEGVINTITKFFDKIFSNTKFKDSARKMLYDMVQNFITKAANFITATITDFLKKLPSFFISCIVTIVATCYISKDYNKLKKFFKGVIDQKKYRIIVDVKDTVCECVFKFITGYFKIFLLTFFNLVVGLLILGNKNFLTVALSIAVLDLFPILGTGTVLIPWSVIEFVKGNFLLGTGLVLLYLVITIIRNFAEPKIIGKQIEINPLFMLIFIFLGFRIGGLVGMLILPLFFTAIFTYLRRKYLQENS